MFYSLLFIAQALCAPARSVLPKNISYSAPGLLPEGFDYFEKKGVFYLGSLTQGTISSVSLDGEQKTVNQTLVYDSWWFLANNVESNKFWSLLGNLERVFYLDLSLVIKP
jgi:hypothetical protein